MFQQNMANNFTFDAFENLCRKYIRGNQSPSMDKNIKL